MKSEMKLLRHNEIENKYVYIMMRLETHTRAHTEKEREKKWKIWLIHFMAVSQLKWNCIIFFSYNALADLC